MIKYFQEKFTMSEHGAKGLIKGAVYNGLYYISIMLPMSLLVWFLQDCLPALNDGRAVIFSWPRYLTALLIAVIIGAILYYLQHTAVFISTYNESESKRIRLAEKLRRLPLSFFGKKDLSDLTSTIMSDCNSVEEMFSHAIPQLIGAFISLSVIAIGLIILDWRMALAALWVMPVVLLIMYLNRKKQKSASGRHFEDKRRVSESMQENLEQMPALLANGRKTEYLERFQDKLRICERSQIRSELIMSVTVNCCQAILKLGFVTTVAVGLKLYLQQDLSMITYLLFLVAAGRIYDPISGSLVNIAHVFSVAAPLERMKTLENTAELGKGIYDFGPDTEQLFTNYNIEFEDVSFEYQDDQPVLNRLSFEAKQGAVTALIGPSGSGKSTAAKLVARFYDPCAGRILIGGIDIKRVHPDRLLQEISIVFQDVNLFDDTVAANIRIGRQDASDEEVRNAARLANCEEFIDRLPEGYATKIGENGARLSGGERQRISIARALLKNASVVLLDEATASLDVENESLIQSALSELLRDKTVLVIAHRMRTIEQADHIVALAEGVKVEDGTPQELMQKNGIFRQMAELQKSGANWSAFGV